ncbi:helicase HerA domain-containing protein [Nitrosopumilus sp.]|uniref:helicase HerA domain-containing protein n=1 Tax=Nitrosopumilus sp. TaxID=2024843 RepID=UPI00292FDE2B|nr:DUF87 domain-containing protein [Nitrosopumilus sp.]
MNLLISYENKVHQRDVWVIQAAIDEKRNDNSLRYSVFHIDTLTFEVTSVDTICPDTKKYTDSLQKTLFSFFKYTASEPKLLQIGEDWSKVTEVLQPRGQNSYITVLDDNKEFSAIQNEIRSIDKRNFPKTIEITDAFEIGYDMDIQGPIIFDIGKRTNYNIAVIRKSGSGKSFTVKILFNRLLKKFPDSYVYVIEPMGEHSKISDYFGMNVLCLKDEKDQFGFGSFCFVGSFRCSLYSSGDYKCIRRCKKTISNVL